MAKYRKLPVVVDAEQYDGSTTHHLMCEGVCRWVHATCPASPHVHTAHDGQAVAVEAGDWIIREPGGRGYYPCKPDIFELTYEPA